MKKIILTLISFIAIFSSRPVLASSINFNIENAEDNILYVDVDIDSLEKINAGDVNIKFDQSLLSVESISTKNSIFNLWMKKVIYSNELGSINFIGGNVKSFSGNGNLIRIKFKLLGDINNKNFIEVKNGYIAEANGVGNNTFKK